VPGRSPSSALPASRRIRWRRAVLRRDPICLVCETEPSTEAHHVAAVHEAPRLAFDVDNGIGCCASCHTLARNAGATLAELRQRLADRRANSGASASTRANMLRLLEG
jgi:hypothetical protein